MLLQVIKTVILCGLVHDDVSLAELPMKATVFAETCKVQISRCQISVSKSDLSDFMTYIWDDDINADTSVRVELQGHTSTGSKADQASSPLFSYANEQHFNRKTYATLISLLDNYNHVVGGSEHTNSHERSEVTNFISAVTNTSIMQETLRFLSEHGYANSWSDLISQLREIWFDMYPRHTGSAYDSSGFEHVFVGEVDDSEVVGFHNWIQFYLQEQDNKLDYAGYIFSKEPNSLGTHFTWLGQTKALGSFMYGTSPEFDMAMFTVCYLLRPNIHCNFNIHGNAVTIQTYTTSHGGGNHLGSAYVN